MSCPVKLDDSPEEKYTEFCLKILVIKILHCWFRFLVLQEMLFEDVKMTFSVLLSCSCVTDIPSAWSWHSDGSCLIPKHPSGFSQGARTFLGGFPSPSAVQGLGVHLTTCPAVIADDAWPKQAAIPIPWFMGELGHPPPGVPHCWIGAKPGAEGGERAFPRDWTVLEGVPKGNRDKHVNPGAALCVLPAEGI